MALTDIELAQKAKSGTFTFGEAIEFAKSKGTKNQKQKANALISGSKAMGISLDTPYKDLRKDDIIKLFTVDGSPDAKNRAYNLQQVENVVRPVLERYGATGTMENVAEGIEEAMYPRLAGAEGLAGTQRTGLAGERPMRGLLPKEELDKIYEEAIPTVEEEYGKATADLLDYHKTTANRPEQLLGLRKSDVTIAGDTITVKGKLVTKKDKKGRPELSYSINSRLGRLLKSNYDTSTSEYLFDVTSGEFTEAFNKHVGSRLEPFADVLPAKEDKVRGPDGETIRTYTAVTTPSAIRSIVPRYMTQQFSVNEHFVEGMMGHVNPSILQKNYTGFVPHKDLVKLIENPLDFAGGEFSTSTTPKLNIDLMTPEQRTQLAEEQTNTILAEEKAKQSTADRIRIENLAKQTSALAAITPEQIQKAQDNAQALEEARIEGKKQARQKTVAEPDPTSVEDLSPELQEKLDKGGFDLSKFLGKSKKAITGVAVGVASQLPNVIPGPADAALMAVIAPEDIEKAGEIGKNIGRDISGQQEGVVPALGEAAGVAAEMITGGVADPDAPVRTSQFLASPIATVASGFINRDKETAPADMYKGGFLSN